MAVMRTNELQTKPLVDIQDLSISFGSRNVLDRVSFSIQPGERVALVGESGSGKSITAMALTRLLPELQAKIGAERLTVNGLDVLKADAPQLQQLRGETVAYIFQEPSSALNPVLKISTQIREALRYHQPENNSQTTVIELLRQTGLPRPEQLLNRYPHQLSGGMQQRVMIAMALACKPKLLVADEPTTSLDVTVQRQIIDLIASLSRDSRMAVLFITHNLALVSECSDRLIVMYAGRIVETGPTDTVLSTPAHPYTRALLNAVPKLDKNKAKLAGIPGTYSDRIEIQGCRFHPRCSNVMNPCSKTIPPLHETEHPGHYSACFLSA